MKPKSQARPTIDGVGGVPLMKHEYLKRDIIHQHMVSHYRRLYSAKCDVDTSTPLYFKPRYRPKAKPLLPTPTLPVQTQISKSDQDKINERVYYYPEAYEWDTGSTRLAKPPLEEKAWIESVLMSVETETGPFHDRGRRSNVSMSQEMKAFATGLRGTSSLSLANRQRTITGSNGFLHQLEKSVSEQQEARNFVESRQKHVSKVYRMMQGDGKKDNGITSKLREMNVYHPPRRRTQSREAKPPRKFCSRCSVKGSKGLVTEYGDNRNIRNNFPVFKHNAIVENQKEDLKYVHFIQSITQDILSKDIYSNEGLNNIFEKHIRMNKSLLEMSKMKSEIQKLKMQLDIPDLVKPEATAGLISHIHETLENSKYNFDRNNSNDEDEDDRLESRIRKESFVPYTSDIQPYNKRKPKPKQQHRMFNNQKYVRKYNFSNFQNIKTVKDTTPCHEHEMENIIQDSSSIKSLMDNEKTENNIDITESKTEPCADGNRVINLLQNMGFDLNMAEEICQCMSDKDLSNFKFPYDEIDDKKSFEDNFNVVSQSNDYVSQISVESDKLTEQTSNSETHPIWEQKEKYAFLDCDNKSCNREIELQEDLLEIAVKDDSATIFSSLSQGSVENKKRKEENMEEYESDNYIDVIGDSSQDRKVVDIDEERVECIRRKTGRESVESTESIDDPKCDSNYEANVINRDSASNPIVSSPIASDYSSMKDHDGSVYDYSCGEEPDEGRESGSEIEEEISEELSGDSSSSGISQLAERLKNFSVENVTLHHHFSPEKWNLICSEKTRKTKTTKESEFN